MTIGFGIVYTNIQMNIWIRRNNPLKPKILLKQEDVCEVTCVDGDKVNRLKGSISQQDTLSVAQIFKALSDDTRIKIAFTHQMEGKANE